MSLSLALIAFFIILTCLLAMGERALTLARRARLESDTGPGKRRTAIVLELLSDPEETILPVRVTIALATVAIGVIAGGGLSDDVVAWIERAGFGSRYICGACGPIVVASVAFLTVLFSVLIPRRIAETYPEGVAKASARGLISVSTLISPVVYILRSIASLLLAPFRLVPRTDVEISEDDIKSVVAEGKRAGVVEEGERQIIHRVFRLGDRLALSVMTPRNHVVSVEGKAPFTETVLKIVDERRSWLPVTGESTDEVLGIVSVHDILELQLRGVSGPTAEVLREVMISPIKVPVTTPALQLLERLRKEPVHFAIIVDEYGGLAGIATLHDLVEAMVGEIEDLEDETPDIFKRHDGSWLVDAGVDIDELWEQLEIPDRSPFDDGDFHSLGGFVMSKLGHVPQEGERFQVSGHQFEVIDMDRHRIDKVLVSKVDEPVQE